MSNLYENNMEMLKEAVDFSRRNLSHNEIIEILKSDNDIQKQYCLIELNSLNSQEEANILIDNLTEKSGPIRETASFKILELISNPLYANYFQSHMILNSFIKGIVDINPSVSRNIVEVIKYTEDSQYLIKNIISEIINTFKELEIIEKTRSYELNKKNFNLYWNLEALFSLHKNIHLSDELVEILIKTAKNKDYTIREKTAKLASVLNIKQIIDMLKTDENIYVRRYFI